MHTNPIIMKLKPDPRLGRKALLLKKIKHYKPQIMQKKLLIPFRNSQLKFIIREISF